MKGLKHTETQWEAWPPASKEFQGTIKASGSDGGRKIIAHIAQQTDYYEAQANLMLAAAAPELLEALILHMRAFNRAIPDCTAEQAKAKKVALLTIEAAVGKSAADVLLSARTKQTIEAIAAEYPKD